MLRNISISRRLLIQLLVVFIGLSVSLGVSLWQLEQALSNSKTDNTRMLVETAYTVIEKQYKAYQQGDISEENAKQLAIEGINNLRYDGNNYFWVNDMHPKMISHPTKPSLNGQDISGFKDPEGKALFVEMVNVVRDRGEGSVAYMWPFPGTDEPVDKISYVKGFAPWGWIVGSGVYLDDVHTTFWHFAKILLSISIFVIAVVGSLAYLISQSINRPITDVVTALEAIASGQGDLTKKLPVEGNDELSYLADHFNNFTQKMRELLLKVKDSTNQLNATTDQLKSAFAESFSAIEAQRRESSAVETAMNEMFCASVNIAKSAEQSATFVCQAEAAANAGKNVVVQTSDLVQRLSSEIDSTSTIIQHLADDSQAISKILEVISGIADQTNLLALNAAIESARAGEQGRGFAVVADEVRTLAAKTQDSTEEIRKMIESVSTSGSRAVTAMNSGTELTTKASASALQGAESLTSVVKEIDNIALIISQAASASEEQSQVSKVINQSIQNIVEATELTYQQFDKARTSELELLELSDELNHLIGEFKL
ncbi:methyl-accepting chemotaxis protein [Alteromonadaceae bacterium BrNp21-10]|nr:methyl-accepting chemotaxis protein [Alteromonadaceae bacterium BrNp21-10]